jgi:Sulfotransferase family
VAERSALRARQLNNSINLSPHPSKSQRDPMICDQYKCIFVEVPKTGSTSIRSIVGEPPKPHLNIWQIFSSVPVEKFTSYFKFGFVRNPWDRAVSLYERREGLRLKSRMSFDDFVDWMKFASSTCMHPVPHRYQLDWFVSPHGDVLADFIGRYENLSADWDQIRARLGISQTLPSLNVNSERKRDYTSYYSQRTRQIVASRFAVDVEYFGYRFGE